MAYSYDGTGWNEYSDGLEDLYDLNKARKRLGFSDETLLYSPLGEVKFYSRGSENRATWAFAFLFLIKMGEGGYYWVWVDTLPNMFKFIQETQITIHRDISSYLETTWFKDTVAELHTFINVVNQQGLHVKAWQMNNEGE